MPNQLRQILAFATVFIFVVVICFYGVADNLDTYPAIRSKPGAAVKPSNRTSPDLSKYESLLTLSTKEFPIDEAGKRVIIVGDIHGMIQPLKHLLKKVHYDPTCDVLIHSGDIISKGVHKGSMKVLDFMVAHHVRGVRGNHDQKVIEWRNWLEYIDTLPGGTRWLERLERHWKGSKSKDADVNEWVEQESQEEEKKLLKLIPPGWTIFSDHYKIAKALSSKQFKYLLGLPLRIYVPSAHVFIAHAGVLPANPKHPIDDKKNQPLARLPTVPRTPGPPMVSPHDVVQQLRNLQEIAVLTQIPQNTDPWVTLNMRSVKHGKIERDGGLGKPWADIWKECMQSCIGYGHNRHVSRIEEGVVQENDSYYWDSRYLETLKAKKHKLPCYPSTTIYGHAASRGLDIKRWSFGLDTGCVYGRKLTAMVIDGQDRRAQNYSLDSILHDDSETLDLNDDDSEDDEHEAINAKPRRISPFADHSQAKFYSVRC